MVYPECLLVLVLFVFENHVFVADIIDFSGSMGDKIQLML